MKLLLCVNNQNDFPCLNDLQAYPQHEITVFDTGYGAFQVAYKVTKHLQQNRYHLALKLGLCNAYRKELAVGTLLNVINEKPGDTGMFADGMFQDLYDLALLDREAEPHVRGGLINMNNSYLNIFSAIKKVCSLTVNTYGQKELVQQRIEKYRADAETGDGIGFVYPCLFEKQPFYQINCVERNLETGEENILLAQEKLNQFLLQTLPLL